MHQQLFLTPLSVFSLGRFRAWRGSSWGSFWGFFRPFDGKRAFSPIGVALILLCDE